MSNSTSPSQGASILFEKFKVYLETNLQDNFLFTTISICVSISVPLLIFLCCCVCCIRRRRKKSLAEKPTKSIVTQEEQSKATSETLAPFIIPKSQSAPTGVIKPEIIPSPKSPVDLKENITVTANGIVNETGVTKPANTIAAVPTPSPVDKKVSETKPKIDSKSRKRKGLLVPGKRASKSVMRAARKYNELSRDLKAILSSGRRSKASVELIAQAKDTIGLEESIRDKIRGQSLHGESARKIRSKQVSKEHETVSPRKSIKSKSSATEVLTKKHSQTIDPEVVVKKQSQTVNPEVETTTSVFTPAVEQSPTVSTSPQDMTVFVEPVYPKKLILPNSPLKLPKMVSQETDPFMQNTQTSGEQIMEPIIIYKQQASFPKVIREDNEEVYDTDEEHANK